MFYSRRQTFLQAVNNARLKAEEIARFLGQSLGRPLLVKEDHSHEWKGQPSDHIPDLDKPLTLQQRLSMASLTINVKISAVFELKSKQKNARK